MLAPTQSVIPQPVFGTRQSQSSPPQLGRATAKIFQDRHRSQMHEANNPETDIAQPLDSSDCQSQLQLATLAHISRTLEDQHGKNKEDMHVCTTPPLIPPKLKLVTRTSPRGPGPQCLITEEPASVPPPKPSSKTLIQRYTPPLTSELPVNVNTPYHDSVKGIEDGGVLTVDDVHPYELNCNRYGLDGEHRGLKSRIAVQALPLPIRLSPSRRSTAKSIPIPRIPPNTPNAPMTFKYASPFLTSHPFFNSSNWTVRGSGSEADLDAVGYVDPSIRGTGLRDGVAGMTDSSNSSSLIGVRGGDECPEVENSSNEDVQASTLR